jgi:hypothetical protein
MQSNNMTSSRSNICQDYVPRYAAPHWTKSTILTSWRGTLLCTSEEVENQRFIQGKIKSPNLTLKSLIYSTGNFGMGRNRQVTCMICNKSMRSDNLNRHKQSHIADSHSQRGPKPNGSNPRTIECFMCGKTILRKNLNRHEVQSCTVFCWNKVKANILATTTPNSIMTVEDQEMSMTHSEMQPYDINS